MPRNWLAVHVFYASNANPLLTDCVEPLVEELRARKLLRHYFFIKYWMEGPHVRVRFLPAPGVSEQQLKAVVEPALGAYLKRRPALYEASEETLAPIYKTMYVAEYGEEQWNATYGPDGVMRFRPNNSFCYLPYEPEYNRYGGPAGIELAEWHFEHSSEIVMRLLRDTNVHVRPIMLGLSVQLWLPLCYVFLGDDDAVLPFLERYMDFWQTSFHQDSSDMFPGFDKSYAKMARELDWRIAGLREAALGGQGSHLTALESLWLSHIRELRAGIEQLVAERKLVFPGRSQYGEQPVEDADTALRILLSSYLHMTNNRLGVSILDEIYLSYVLSKALTARQTGLKVAA